MAYGVTTSFTDSSDGTDVPQTSAPDPLNITLGIELEFILAVSTYPEKATFENADEVVGMSVVRYALSQPMTATCASCGAQHVFQLQVHTNGSVEYENRFGYWNVDEDRSLNLTDDEEKVLGEGAQYFHFHEIEIKSRVLRPAKNLTTTPGTDHVHEISHVEEINAVLNKLRELLSGPKRGNKFESAHIILNGQCGLHVHVGNENRGFPLPTVKKVLSTYVANERAIDNLLASSRIGGSKLATMPLDNPWFDIGASERKMEPFPYSPPWSEPFIALAHTLRRQRLGYNNSECSLPRSFSSTPYIYPETHLYDPTIGRSVDSFHVGDFLTIIDNAPTLGDIQRRHHCFGRPTLNIGNLGEHNSDALPPDPFDEQYDGIDAPWYPSLMTLEFRQHAGSLDSAEIHAWVDFVVSMVDHAHYTSDAYFHEVSRNEWLKPNHGSIDLLQELGCSEDTLLFYSERLAMGQHLRPANESVSAADIADIDIFPVDALIAPLLEYVAWKRQQDYHPGAVLDRIKEKFRVGGYGKFSDEYLDELLGADMYDPHLGLRDKLSTNSEKRRWK